LGFFAILIGINICALTGVFAYLYQADPGRICVYFKPEECKTITVTSSNFVESRVFQAVYSPAVVTPIGHGSYVFHVHFKDDKNLYFEYFHIDAGKRKEVDIYVDRMDGSRARLKLWAYGRSVLANEAVDMDQSSKASPYNLYGP
jgi:hypothetical protein